MKKFLAIFLALATAFAFSVCASAEPFAPYDMGTATKTSTLTISGRTATCKSEFKNTDSNIPSCVITQTLEKQGLFWQYGFYDGTWTTSSNGSSVALTSYSYNLPDGTYHVKSVFGVTSNTGVYREYTVYSDPVTIP